jgi:hypothetical protein
VSKYLTPALLGGVFGAGLILALLIVLWPPGWLAGSILGALALLLAIALAVHVRQRRRYRPPWQYRADQASGLSAAELDEWRMNALIEREQRLEFRELQLARQMRALQLANEDYLDVLEPEPSREELENLVERDRELIALIEAESQRAFDRVLANRYAAESGINTALILSDLRDFIEQVARLYRPESEDPLLETEIELIAKSLSSAALHILVIVEDLPLNLKSYNTAKMYRLVQRGASYYGTYKTFRPYVEHGLNILQAARLALGVNPATAGAAWVAGKLTTHGAKAIGERVLQRRSLQLLNDFIRVIGFEAAMIYGGDLRHRDANWVLGAELVNLEISRGDDLGGRDAALVTLCNLALRHEFDRIRLLNHLAKHRRIDVERVMPQVIMTKRERDDTAAVLSDHCRKTGVDMEGANVAKWRAAAEAVLGVSLDLPGEPQPEDEPSGLKQRLAAVASRLRRRLKRRS